MKMPNLRIGHAAKLCGRVNLVKLKTTEQHRLRNELGCGGRARTSDHWINNRNCPVRTARDGATSMIYGLSGAVLSGPERTTAEKEKLVRYLRRNTVPKKEHRWSSKNRPRVASLYGYYRVS